MVPASGSLIKKAILSTARMRESDAADPSAAAARWAAASVPEKHRQARRVTGVPLKYYFGFSFLCRRRVPSKRKGLGSGLIRFESIHSLKNAR